MLQQASPDERQHLATRADAMAAQAWTAKAWSFSRLWPRICAQTRKQAVRIALASFRNTGAGNRVAEAGLAKEWRVEFASRQRVGCPALRLIRSSYPSRTRVAALGRRWRDQAGGC